MQQPPLLQSIFMVGVVYACNPYLGRVRSQASVGEMGKWVEAFAVRTWWLEFHPGTQTGKRELLLVVL